MIIAAILITLFIVFAVTNLVVGVSNDAVNFLHSAIGSGVARKKYIYWVASIGLVLGAFFAQSMMGLARTGVVVPELFSFYDLMAVFIAVLLVNIVLIDLCNTYAIPTSTTTALIIELTGGAMALAFVKSLSNNSLPISSFINTNHIFIILAGIFISVLVAFIVGMITQFIARLLFTFQTQKHSSFLLSLAGSIAITIIFFFIIKQVLLIDWLPWENAKALLEIHISKVLGIIFAISFSVFMFSGGLFNISIPRIVVIFGTFAMAMSFAAKDLVNFIGIPLAGIDGTIKWLNSGVDAKAFNVGFMSNGSTYNYDHWLYVLFFALSGIILAITLFRSSKTKAVIDTELLLEQQTGGNERFGSSELSRHIVRVFLQLYNKVQPNTPTGISAFLKRRFQQPATTSAPLSGNTTHFDTIRAAVNLVVSSIIILSGTWFKIPVSTTFIVFMVAMGSSLADQAWGRENAVYRVSGMLTVLTVWQVVSILAFVLTGLLTIAIWYGGVITIVLLIIGAVISLYYSNKYFQLRRKREMVIRNEIKRETEINLEWMYETGSELFRKHLLESSKIYFLTLQGFVDEDITKLREANEKANVLVNQIKVGKQSLLSNISRLNDNVFESGHHFIQAYDYLLEMANSLHHLTTPILEHIENNHQGLNELQCKELTHLQEETTTYFNFLVHLEKELRFTNMNDLIRRQQILFPFIDELRKNQLKRLKSGDSKTRVSILYIEILAETKNILLYSVNMTKSHRDFYNTAPTR